MKPKRVVRRRRVAQDIDNIVDHYLGESGENTALAVIGDVERTLRHIASYPGSGSPRYAHELGLPGLRSWPLAGFPYLVFYIEHDDWIDVWRILHSHRNVPAWLTEGS